MHCVYCVTRDEEFEIIRSLVKVWIYHIICVGTVRASVVIHYFVKKFRCFSLVNSKVVVLRSRFVGGHLPSIFAEFRLCDCFLVALIEM